MWLIIHIQRNPIHIQFPRETFSPLFFSRVAEEALAALSSSAWERKSKIITMPSLSPRFGINGPVSRLHSSSVCLSSASHSLEQIKSFFFFSLSRTKVAVMCDEQVSSGEAHFISSKSTLPLCQSIRFSSREQWWSASSCSSVIQSKHLSRDCRYSWKGKLNLTGSLWRRSSRREWERMKCLFVPLSASIKHGSIH